MDNTRGRNTGGHNIFTAVLVFGAMVFGMVLAGGTDLVPVSSATPQGAAGSEATGGVKVTPPAVSGLPSFADLAEAVSPAVVSIQSTRIETGGESRGQDPFEFFFGPRRRAPQQQQEPQERRSDSAGSGFVISPDGLIITNHHVIEDATELTVHLNGREYPAEVKGDDPATDIALLKVEADEPLTYLDLGDSDSLRPGDWIMVIGSPLQLENSVSVGVVSAKARSIRITPDPSLESFIQTDAAINFGNSGGPLVDLQGRVVGIATAINFGAENIGFAVPVSTLKTILPQLRDRGAVKRGYLGVEIGELTHDWVEALGLSSTDGVLVTRVTEGGPAEDADFERGDVILTVDGRVVPNVRDLIDYVAAKQPGTKVKVELFREGEGKIEKTVELGERTIGSEGIIEPEDDEEESGIEWLGLQFQNLSDELIRSHELPEDLSGVLVSSVAPSSPLWDENVRPGDIIVELNRQKVEDARSFEGLVEAVPSGGYLRFYVERYRGGQSTGFFAIVRVP